MSKYQMKIAKVKMHRWPYSGKLHPVDEKHHEESKAEYLKRMTKEREKKAFFATTPFKVKDEKEL